VGNKKTAARRQAIAGGALSLFNVKDSLLLKAIESDPLQGQIDGFGRCTRFAAGIRGDDAEVVRRVTAQIGQAKATLSRIGDAGSTHRAGEIIEIQYVERCQFR